MTNTFRTKAAAAAFVTTVADRYPDTLVGNLAAEALAHGGLDLRVPRGQWMVALLKDMGLSHVDPISIRYGLPATNGTPAGIRKVANRLARQCPELL